MSHAIRIHQFGGPDVLRWEEVPVGKPGPGHIRMRQKAVGLNYVDVYHRTGLYPVNLPAVLGTEAAGIVEETGPGVTEFKSGDRVAYATAPPGAYAQERVLPADKVVKIPEGVSEETAAAVLLKGMTVEYLFHRTFPLVKGQTILFHAAAGGVGLLACQWARHLGCTVIGTAGSEEKAEAARKHGCHHVILTSREKISEKVMELTKGKGVPVVYDAVGKDTFQESLDSLAHRGMLVSFGQASGPVPEVNLKIFSPKNLYYTRPSLFVYNATREELLLSAERTFEAVRKGILKVEISNRYPLEETARAHRDLESRKLTGSTVLLP